MVLMAPGYGSKMFSIDLLPVVSATGISSILDDYGKGSLIVHIKRKEKLND